MQNSRDNVFNVFPHVLKLIKKQDKSSQVYAKKAVYSEVLYCERKMNVSILNMSDDQLEAVEDRLLCEIS